MSLIDLLLGRPLASSEEKRQRIGPAYGIPIFGLDSLSSAAYGPEAALTILRPLGAAGIAYVVPISLSIIALLAVLYFSYRQTIEAYPTGGGAYTVARRNLGSRASLLAAAALMIDYVLNVAVGIAAGVGAVVSALPLLQPHTLALCLAILLVVTVVNLRGVREPGLIFMAPTYLFVACLLGAIAIGTTKALLSGGHPIPVVAPPRPQAVTAVSAWLLVKAFSSGCTAMTGVEAVSNGVQAFREPVVQAARRTLTVIIAILALMLAGIAYLARAYNIGATEPGGHGYETVLSQLTAAVSGKGGFYYITTGAILLVLSLSANTSFAGFPRLCRAIAENGYLPPGFASRGRRLVYTHGIYAVAGFSAVLLILFGGVTDRLIPLFAVGALLAFTLSQAGMVAHWWRQSGRHARSSMWINALGAAATGITVLVVIVAKFTEGAWITLVLIPALILLMVSVRKHYHRVAVEIASPSPLEFEDLRQPIVVVPIDDWNRVVKKALRFALTLSEQVQALHVDAGDESDTLQKEWDDWVSEPARVNRVPPPELVILKSPYRYVITPILNYVLDLERRHRTRQIAVVISGLVERRWYHYLLHNQRAQLLTALLMLKGDQRIVIVNVPWYLTA